MPGASGDLLECERVGDVTVARVKPPMLRGDDATEELFRELYALLDEAGCKKLVLNLAPVDYVASVTLGRLVTLVTRARAAKAGLAVCQLKPVVERSLEVARLADMMNIYADERTAVQSLG
jgi:anti-anti-sigma factor